MADYIGYKDDAVGTTFVPIVVPLGEPISTAVASAAATIVATVAASFKDWFPAKHSNWWHFDTAFENKDWAKVVAMSAKFYNIDGLNYIDWEKNPISDHIPAQYTGFTRLKLLPIVYSYTNDPFILKLMQEAVQKGKLPVNVLPAAAATYDPYTASQAQTDPNNPSTVIAEAAQSIKSVGNANWILYGGIALALFLILKKK
jgi:hypothetical protein